MGEVYRAHPNTLAIHEFDDDQGMTFAITELLEGETLRDLVNHGPVRATEIAEAITDGLGATHAAGVAHRDFKPENVFITEDRPLAPSGRLIILRSQRRNARPEPVAATGPAPASALGECSPPRASLLPPRCAGTSPAARHETPAAGS
jgi:serine/threonine protein kinase